MWEKLEKIADTLIRFEVHALFVMLVGLVLALTGHKDEANLAIGGALGILKGKS